MVWGLAVYILGIIDWMFYYLLVQYVGIGVLAVYLLYRTRFKVGFRASFYRKSGVGQDSVNFGGYEFVYDKKGNVVDVQRYPAGRNSNYVWVGETEFRASAKAVSYGKRKFPIDFSYMCFRKFGFTNFSFDIDSGDLLNFGGEREGMPPEKVDVFCDDNLLRNLFSRLGGIDKVYIILFAVMVVIGVVAGLFGGYTWGHGSGFDAGFKLGNDTARAVGVSPFV